MGLRRTAKALIAGIVGAGLTVAVASPAQAHETYLAFGQSYAYVGPGHTRIVWCDHTKDSSAVRAWYYTQSLHYTRAIWAEGCGEWQTDHQITSYCLDVVNTALLCRET
jgi:hypothetical protein